MLARWISLAISTALLCQAYDLNSTKDDEVVYDQAYGIIGSTTNEVVANGDIDFNFNYDQDGATIADVRGQQAGLTSTVNKGPVTKECGQLYGTATRPTVNYATPLKFVDSNMKEVAADYVNQAKKYGREARFVVIGDSIIRHVGRDSGCTKTIFDKYGGKGFVWGISGMMTDFCLALVDSIFSQAPIAPKAVYIAIGVNDCIRMKIGGSNIIDARTWQDVANYIIKIVQVIKYWSPSTHVIVQKILPTSAPNNEAPSKYEGKYFKDFPLYTFITSINNAVQTFINTYNKFCLSGGDLTYVVLDSSAKFKKGAFDDGLHFEGSGNMGAYCAAIKKEGDKYYARSVSARAEGEGFMPEFRDVPFGLQWVSDTVYHTWKYNPWSNCTGACGVQHRTAECHRVDTSVGNSSLASYTVEEAECKGILMSPLDRVCKLDDSCLPDEQAQPIPSLMTDEPSKSDGIKGAVGMWVLLGLNVATLAGLAVALMLLRSAYRAPPRGDPAQASALPIKPGGNADDEEDGKGIPSSNNI